MPGKIHGLTSIETQEATLDAVEDWVARDVAVGRASHGAGVTRMRVMHVVDSLAASGGAEQRLVEEVEAIADRFDQRVVRLYARDELQPRLERAGIPVVNLGMTGRHAGRTWPWAVLRLRRELRDWRPDVIHTTLFSANLTGQLAARTLGIPGGVVVQPDR